jgi:hypothetical protein
MAAMQQAMKLNAKPMNRVSSKSMAAPRAAVNRPSAAGRKMMNVSANALPLVGNTAPGACLRKKGWRDH